jgi:uncharacterized protein YjiS (DUF1127 family)
MESIMFATIATTYARWRSFHNTQRALEALDDRTLRDIGLYRRNGRMASDRTMLRTLGLR